MARFLRLVRRVSARIYTVLLLVLLSVVYVLVFPWFAVARRFRRRPEVGWRLRSDPRVASIERLRSPF